MRVKREQEENFELMLVPMIDCLFILVVFFLLTTTLKVTKKEIPINLPNSGAAIDQKQEEQTVVLGIDQAGQKYFNAQPITTSALQMKLRGIAEKSRETKIRIDADENAKYVQCVEMFGMCSFEGLHNVGIHTRDTNAPKP